MKLYYSVMFCRHANTHFKITNTLVKLTVHRH